MINTEALKRFEKLYDVRIDQLFWIAGVSLHNDELESLLSFLRKKHWERLFPEIYRSKFFEEIYEEKEDLINVLTDFEKYGFLAKVLVPQCQDFRYTKDGEPKGWMICGFVCRVEYVYAETTELLLEEIEKVSSEVFKEYVEKDKKKQKVKSLNV